MTTLDIEDQRDQLSGALMADDVADRLWHLVDSGLADVIVPELPALRLEQDPIHKHKDVLSHTIAVTAKTPVDLRLRLAALFHDIGKPQTRSFDHGGVTFRHHEAVGAKITKKRLRALEYPSEIVRDVAELVRLSGRFKGYADGWSDAAVRRYARDAGPLLGMLNSLVRSDCTTRNQRKRLELQHHVDQLEQRIAELAEADRRAAERPLIDGDEVMARFDLEPGPLVGQALRFLLELKRNEPGLDRAATEARLDEWYASKQP
ncbi:MAG: HDIG domain-containing metalloprotein [Acidimicrobiales bacterium]